MAWVAEFGSEEAREDLTALLTDGVGSVKVGVTPRAELEARWGTGREAEAGLAGMMATVPGLAWGAPPAPDPAESPADT